MNGGKTAGHLEVRIPKLEIIITPLPLTRKDTSVSVGASHSVVKNSISHPTVQDQSHEAHQDKPTTRKSTAYARLRSWLSSVPGGWLASSKVGDFLLNSVF